MSFRESRVRANCCLKLGHSSGNIIHLPKNAAQIVVRIGVIWIHADGSAESGDGTLELAGTPRYQTLVVCALHSQKSHLPTRQFPCFAKLLCRLLLLAR